MNRTTRLLSSIVLGGAVAALAATAAAVGGEHSHAKIGEPAPGFTLTDTQGREHTLSDYKGKVVVLEWINTECPWVVGCYKREAMQKAYTKVNELTKDKGGVKWIAVNTTYSTTAEANDMWIEKFKLEYPIALDLDGTAGHLYNARRTPHMFVVDQEGILRYHGAIDNNKMGGKTFEEATNYVVNAVKQIVEGETVAPDYISPYGCTVKYKK